jgi:virginiamycin A acetyltransferase
VKRFLKASLGFLMRVFVLPLALIAGFGKFHEGFVFGAQFLAPFPGMIGSYLRVAYYSLTLQRCGRDCHIGPGSYFAHATASLGDRVGIGAYCVLGQVHLGEGALLASGVQVISGRAQHARSEAGDLTDEGSVYSDIMIGPESWVGANSVIMANLGPRVTVAAGSVVARDVQPGTTVAGNPARPVRQTPAVVEVLSGEARPR